MAERTARVGVIGGSGFYELGAGGTETVIATPWGSPSSPVVIGDVDGVPIAFLARHGAGHHLPPHRVDHRANLWALREVGVERVVASFACGSLRGDLGPGSLVVPDQLLDQTRGRADTIHDTFDDGPQHAAFADPYSAEVRAALLGAGEETAEPVHDGATVVVINGPRFATRAESRAHRAMGADLINMTQYPETVIARELGLAYGALGLVTDFDAGLEDRPDVEAVTQDAVFQVFAANLPRLRRVVTLAAVHLG